MSINPSNLPPLQIAGDVIGWQSLGRIGEPPDALSIVLLHKGAIVALVLRQYDGFVEVRSQKLDSLTPEIV